MFSGLDYRIGATLAGVLMLLLTNVLPVFGLFSRNSMGTLCRSNIFWTFLLYAYRARHFGNETPWWYAMLHPFGIGVFIYDMLRSASTTLVRGGISGRHTISSERLEGRCDLIGAYRTASTPNPERECRETRRRCGPVPLVPRVDQRADQHSRTRSYCPGVGSGRLPQLTTPPFSLLAGVHLPTSPGRRPRSTTVRSRRDPRR